jgi:hypothetical protein
MFLREICDKSWRFLGRSDRLDRSGARLAQRRHPAQTHCPLCREMLFNVDLLDEAHDRSSLSAACLDVARLEQSLES